MGFDDGNHVKHPSIIDGFYPTSGTKVASVIDPNNNLICGGVLISPIQVLTARHCLDDGVPSHRVRVRLGSIHLHQGGIVRNTMESRPVPSAGGDLMIIRLTQAVSNPNLPSIARSHPPVNASNSVWGWGRVGPNMPWPNFALKGATVRARGTDHTDSYGVTGLAYRRHHSDSQAGTTCYKDSGGPHYAREGRNGLVGIISQTLNPGPGTGHCRDPHVSASLVVPANRNWLVEQCGGRCRFE